MSRSCSLCERRVVARGLCGTHYKAAERAGTLPRIGPLVNTRVSFQLDGDTWGRVVSDAAIEGVAVSALVRSMVKEHYSG